MSPMEFECLESIDFLTQISSCPQADINMKIAYAQLAVFHKDHPASPDFKIICQTILEWAKLLTNK